MELSEQDIELIDRYSRNELSKEELSAFKKRMRDDRNFSAEVNSIVSAMSVINEMGRDELRNQLSQIKTELDRTNDYEKYKPGKKKGGSGGSIAFLIIIAGIIIYYFNSHDIKHYFHSLDTPPEVDTVYHYNVIRDTIYERKYDTIREIKSDTIEIKKLKKIYKADTVYLNENEMLKENESGKSENRKIYNRIVSGNGKDTVWVSELAGTSFGTDSAISRLVKMPDLVDVSYKQAQAILKSSGLKTGEIIFRSDNAKYAVLEMRYKGKKIEPGTIVPKGSVINLVLGDGTGSRDQ